MAKAKKTTSGKTAAPAKKAPVAKKSAAKKPIKLGGVPNQGK